MAARAAGLAGPLLLGGLFGCLRHGPGPGPPRVFAADDSERIGRWDGEPPAARAQDNPIWSPGQPVRLFALPGETVAFQVAVTGGKATLVGVTVDLPALRGPDGALISPSPAPGVAQVPWGLPWRPIERFVTHELQIMRRSGGKDRGESLGWSEGAMPKGPPNGFVPDALIPVERAPLWADYPMTVHSGENRVVWIDITVAEGTPAGDYRSEVQVQAAGPHHPVPLGELKVELHVGPAALPYAAARTMVYYGPDEISGRTGSQVAVQQYLQLMHRHGLTPVYRLDTPADVFSQKDELTGALFTRERGYDGPGQGRGVDVLSLGTYGSLGPPTAERVAQVQEVLAALKALGMPLLPQRRDAFLYAVDEQCQSPLGPDWRAALSASGPELQKLRVGHTCSSEPQGQGVSLPIVHAAAYDTERVLQARRLGKQVWIYNGSLPQTGSFLLDGGAVSLVVNGWIQARYGIDRWFYWESTFWNDDNRGGHGPYDPFQQAETFHNQHGDHANGDGVLVYPGTQAAFPAHSLGFAGVVPSIRLKLWRRGISDAGYYLLAHAIDPQETERIAAALVPRALSGARPGHGASWPAQGAPYYQARRQLFEIILRGPAR